MTRRLELTDEELKVSCGWKLYLVNILVALALSLTTWIPISGVFAALGSFWPILSSSQAVAVATGFCTVAGVVWAIMVARRFSALSYAFNQAGLKVRRHNVVQAELRWDDVDKVVIGMPIVIRTKDGSVTKLPMALLVSERYENRALNCKLYRLEQ